MYILEGVYLHKLILRGIWKLFMEAVLQNLCYVSHAITTCKTKSINGKSNTRHAFMCHNK